MQHPHYLKVNNDYESDTSAKGVLQIPLAMASSLPRLDLVVLVGYAADREQGYPPSYGAQQ